MKEQLSDLQAFHRFVGEKLSRPGVRLSPEEALAEWRKANPVSGNSAEELAMLQVALVEADRGEADSLESVVANIRRKHQLRSPVPVD